MPATATKSQFRFQLEALGTALQKGQSIDELTDSFQQLLEATDSDEERANLLLVWANAEAYEGRYGAAMQLFERCACLTPRAYIKGSCLKNIALIHYWMGDFRRARSCAEEALVALRVILGAQVSAQAEQIIKNCDWEQEQVFPSGERRLQLVLSRQIFGPELGRLK